MAQEAFRLYRTAQNLLTLKDPVLGESKPHRGSLIDLNRTSLDTTPLYAPMINRKLNSRESRISFQSSSDGSVHSNSSSSRIETDEENTMAPGINHTAVRLTAAAAVATDIDIRKDRIKSVASSSADDESGFSSMNSFHHDHNLMLPAMPATQFNSTMISHQFYPDAHDDCDLLQSHLHDLSLKPVPKLPARDSICASDMHNGLPMNNRRYDLAPPLPPKRNMATFNSILQAVSDDKSQTGGINVAWV